MAKKINAISNETLAQLQTRSTLGLSNNPSEKNASPDKIKDAISGVVVGKRNSVVSEINRVVYEVNEQIGSLDERLEKTESGQAKNYDKTSGSIKEQFDSIDSQLANCVSSSQIKQYLKQTESDARYVKKEEMGIVYKAKGSYGDLDENKHLDFTNFIKNNGELAEGYVLNITKLFITDERFLEGEGVSYEKGTNIVVIKDKNTNDLKLDVIGGSFDLSMYVKEDVFTSQTEEQQQTNKLFRTDLQNKVDSSEIKDVARTGSYNDLFDRPEALNNTEIDNIFK